MPSINGIRIAINDIINHNYTNIGGLTMMDFQKFKYTRGFVVSDRNLDNTFLTNWEKHKNKYFYFYFDKRADWEYIDIDNNIWGCVIGNCLDPFNSTDNLKVILDRAITFFKTSNDLLFNYIETLVGRYVFILGNKDRTIIFTDATGMKSLFFHSEQKLLSSHAKLLFDITNESTSSLVDLNWLGKYSNYH